MKQYSRFSVITNSKFILCALLLSQTLLGCAALGTKTLYKTESEYKIQITTLGFVKPHLGSFAVMKFPETSELMTNTFIQYMNESGDYNFKVVEDSSQIDFFYPDAGTINSICKSNEIDGLIIADLRFTQASNIFWYVPPEKRFDTEVQLKLFDKYGNLILHTIHSTNKGNSYLMPPGAKAGVKDGTRGALKRLINELQKLQS